MDVGLLLLINFLTIPFWSEVEHCRKQASGKVRVSEVLWLRNFMKQRWKWFYLVFLLLFATVLLGPSASGKAYYASWELLAGIFVMHMGLFFYLFRRGNSQK